MAVYVDQLFPTARKANWPFDEACHLLTDGPIEELHAFARKLSLKPEWFQGHHANPALHHYDLTKNKRLQALKLGASEIADGQQFLAVINREVQAPLRTALVGQRYEYSVQEKCGLYIVQCRDMERPRHTFKHGPFSLPKANAMIDTRLRRDEDLKR